MNPRKIQIRSYPSSTTASRPPLLFVHGAYVNATCWEYNFIPYFRQRGYDCHTVDLSGHGESEGREHIDNFTLQDYAEDVSRALQKIGSTAILVGHSMGCRVLERYLDSGEAAGVIFLSPVPTTGTAGSAIQLALRYPGFIQAINAAVNGQISLKTGELITKIYFSPDVTPHEALQFLPMLGPESQLAVAEMALPDVRWGARRRPLPALVAGGTYDAVFPASMLHFMASAWRADVFRTRGAGHMLMLDPQWESLAEHMLAWMESRIPG